LVSKSDFLDYPSQSLIFGRDADVSLLCAGRGRRVAQHLVKARLE
jgi:hypothetical protein